MTDERWNALVEMGQKNFQNFSYRTEDLVVETEDRTVKQGTQDIMEFQNDIGSFKVVRETKPKVLDKKMHFSHQQGKSSQAEYVFSETETVKQVRFFMLDDMDEWKEIDSSYLGVSE